MNLIHQYLITLIVAFLIVGILTTLIHKKSASGAMIKLISGIFLAFTMLTPLLKIKIGDLNIYYEGITADAEVAISEGKNMAQEATNKIIKEKLEAYILDKALDYHLEIEVELTLTGSLPSSPDSVKISGNVSPYTKQMMQKFLEEEIGIPTEKQIWQ